ncbi:hypothetical protein PMAYCL1PPCAC_23759 [Pristionchus mayeri]|uniref:Arginyl-tRNA--protein transferase 1 n=1 Tax=Pristionchus mayeri TaxID=1317129 RepID=A0AAN5I6T0_9BILA|nr:hypothetical protein PMAYCL1PPCAC_23759 [Pristionchus mayeri]
MGERTEEISIVELLGWSDGGKCGYCKDGKGDGLKRNLGEKNEEEEKEALEGGSVSLGCAAYSMHVRDFENFLLWGWSRSGSYIYKPFMEKTCCPQYTIRLDVGKFILSRTQKKVLRNMRLYLEKGVKAKGGKEEREDMSKRGGQIGDQEMKEENNEEKKPPKVEKGLKKKEIRRKKAIEKWMKKGLNVEDEMEKRMNKEKMRVKTLEDRIGSLSGEGFAHELEIRLVAVDSEEYVERADEEYQLFKKYQESIHSDDDVSRRGFDRFLVKTPLTSADRSMGSFHMRYMVDGRIVAVGVVDILVESVSAKYLFYDPSFSFLSLGTYTALQEIQLVRKLQERMPRLRYYYMGYYISDCPKMRYKGAFRPSDLLCDRSLSWVPLSECSPLLSSNSHLFTLFRPSLPTAPRLDPRNAKLYLGGEITNLNSLPPFVRSKITDKLESFCAFTTPDASKIVLVIKELQIDGMG